MAEHQADAKTVSRIIQLTGNVGEATNVKYMTDRGWTLDENTKEWIKPGQNDAYEADDDEVLVMGFMIMAYQYGAEKRKISSITVKPN